MIRGRFIISGGDLSAVDRLRREGAFPGDAHDEMAVYAIAVADPDIPVGMGRMYIDDESRYRIDGVYVLPELRKKGLGDLIVRMLLFRAQELSAQSVWVDCDPSVRDFFAGYGFSAPDGQARNPVRLRLSGQDIALGCGDCKSCQ